MTITYKYRLKGKRSVRLLRRHAFGVNQVWNFCSALQRDTNIRWRNGSRAPWLSQFDLQKLTAGTSKVYKVHAQSVNGVCERFTKSRDQHKKRPKFRKSGGPKRSLGWVPFETQSRQITPSSVTYLGHTFRFFGAKKRPLPMNAKGGCFTEDAQGHWYVCFYVNVEKDNDHDTKQIGIDLGLKTLATQSDGKKIEPIQAYRKYEEKLAVAQRAGNSKRVKALHAKIKNVRSDYLHKASNKIVKENGFIAVGNVSVETLRNTKPTKGVFKSLYDASLSTFREMLCYKASRHGAKYVVVDEDFTTQTCSSCASTNGPKGIAGLGIREWICSDCGASHDRDVNAARNILKLGLSAQPRVDESRDSR